MKTLALALVLPLALAPAFTPASALASIPTFFCLGSTQSAEAARHPIHISLAQIEFNPKTRSFEVSLKLFADDFEDVINKTNNVMLRLGSQRELPNANALIFAYIERHFRINIGGKAVTMTFLGKEMEAEAVWVYAEIPMQAASKVSIQSLTVTNTLMFDLFDDQSNLLNASINGSKQSALFRHGNDSAVLKFN